MDKERKMTIRKSLFETLRCAPYPLGRQEGIEPLLRRWKPKKRRQKSETKTVDGGQSPWHKMGALPRGAYVARRDCFARFDAVGFSGPG
jgi:hypothetical protein